MGITRQCAELLESASRFHVQYGDRLANHLPMVLIALDQLDAPAERLQDAFERGASHLPPRPVAPVEPVSDIRNCRGDNTQFASALHYYETQLRQHGIDQCLRSELPALLPAIACSAFHGAIRTAYGIDAAHLEEIAMGLTYWNLAYQELSCSAARTPTPAATVIGDVAKKYPEIQVAPGNIADHMRGVTGQPGWQETPVQPERLSLDEIATVALLAYRSTGNFTLLHGVTGCHALRILLPYCEDPEQAMRFFWEGLVIAYLSTGPLPLSIPEAESDRERLTDLEVDQRRAVLRARALESDDDHVVKLAYSALSEFSYYGDPEYLKVFG